MVTVDTERQAAFAVLSGDYNPLHMDQVEARRTQFGAPVVHGIHLVLLALEALDEPGPWQLESLDARFRSAAPQGDMVAMQIARETDTGHRITVRSGGQIRATINCQLTPGGATTAPAHLTAEAGLHGAVAGTNPAALTLEELRSSSGREPVWLDAQLFSSLFPRLATAADAWDMATLLATTRVVGMRAPGRWALFRRLTWTRTLGVDAPPSHDTEGLFWSTISIDERLSLATLDIHDAAHKLHAEVIIRRPPPAQPNLHALTSAVIAGEFAGTRALVVGGSRGLGELASKIIVAGGGQVLLSFRTGAADARAILAQLGDAAHAVELDVECPSGDALAAIRAFVPTQILYFATPPITRRPPGSWDPTTYARFLNVYVTGLSTLLGVVDPLSQLRGLLFPSSIYVEEHPAGFAEYAAAKAAGEALCATWQHLRPEQTVVVPRFPPLITDQTAARSGDDTRANIKPLLTVIRKLLAQSDASEFS